MGIKTRRFRDDDEFADEVKSGGGVGGVIWSIPKKDGIEVRFLADPKDWVSFDEVWDDQAKTSYAVLEDEQIGDDLRVSTRYLAPAVHLDRDEAILLRIPKSLANDLWEAKSHPKYENTLLGRVFLLRRSGEGLSTSYGFDADRLPSDFDLDAYEIPDAEEALLQQREDAMSSASTKNKPKKRGRRIEDDDDEDDDPF